MRGIVVSFSANKGYGFITAGGDDYFFHWSDILDRVDRTMHRGDWVVFDPCTTTEGLSASNVRKDRYE